MENIITDTMKMVAVNFAQWCGNNRYWYNVDVEGTWYKLLPNKEECDMSKRYSTDELYEMFLVAERERLKT